MRKKITLRAWFVLSCCFISSLAAQTGVGVPAPAQAHILFDGSRAKLDSLWIYWQGPRLTAQLPIKWQIVADPAHY